MCNFPKTKALYYDDQYMSEFSAKVVSVNQQDGRIYDIILDQTAFFPESGGQTCDRGHIANAPVINVQIENGVIIHTIDFVEPNGSIPSVGDTVTGTIDFMHRFSNMQQHTGEHIFSGFVNKLFGYDNSGFHLSENRVTMDYTGPLTDDDVFELEVLSNGAIFRNLPVKAYFPTKEELENLSFRAKLELEEMGDVRIVTIADNKLDEPEIIDSCACCAPHVRGTSEVGLLKVVDRANYKGGTRVTILCGMRALADYDNKHESLLALSRKLSAPLDEIYTAVLKLYDDMKQKEDRIKELEEQLVWHALSKARKHNEPIIFTNIEDNILLRNTANDLIDSGNAPVFILNGSDVSGYNFIIASDLPEEEKKDAVSILHLLQEHLEIRGGGKNPMVTGKCTSKASKIESVIKGLLEDNPL